MEELHRKMQAIEFILGIGGAENELVQGFRKWPEERLQDYLNNLQAEKTALIQQQQSTEEPAGKRIKIEEIVEQLRQENQHQVEQLRQETNQIVDKMTRQIDDSKSILPVRFRDKTKKSCVKILSLTDGSTSIGVGFFVSANIVITTLHHYTEHRSDDEFTNDIKVGAIYPAHNYAGVHFEMKLKKYHRGYDLAVFEVNTSSGDWLSISSCNITDSFIRLALASFGIGMTRSINDPTIFSEDFIVLPAVLIRISNHHIVYSSNAFSGDSGGALLYAEDGNVIAMHQETVNEANEELDMESNIDIKEVTDSMNSLTKGLSQGFVGLRLDVPDIQAIIFGS